MEVKNGAIKRMTRVRLTVAALVCAFLTSATWAGEEVPSRCEKGTYAGKVPGKTSYRKDSFVWAVSAKFAADYCMPDSFVDADLPQGVEAVAYRRAEDYDTQACILTEGVETCNPLKDHVLEIYVRHNAVMHAREGRFFDSISAPSVNLINEKLSSTQARLKSGQVPAGASGVSIFDSSQILLATVADGKTNIRFGGMYLRTFFEGILDGLDYLAVHGQLGFTHRSIWKRRTSQQDLYFLIDHLRRPDEQRLSWAESIAPRELETFVFSLKIPKRIEAAMIAEDQR
ncbi:hypothetical protein [Roseateles depolymerans]|uniref:Uncharacterized protein n=1 Tax=Roseateles depolymerans TaxID=76731 RepID=A0A0U3ME31_9BURK|nr:hypothetical protein [Roseateles depolymerans]ALV06569.1 hypothetical protein RD2015_2094 [Roseateles depolymerans]REG19544.1 hypothetical protein DES44_2040 [Roseateles depolymerans]